MYDLLKRYPVYAFVLILAASLVGAAKARGEFTQAAADRMISAAEGKLAPVYAPLAKEIAKTLSYPPEKTLLILNLINHRRRDLVLHAQRRVIRRLRRFSCCLRILFWHNLLFF